MTIQQLSQETGIGVDTLRIWERRYGFPMPGRDRRGHRDYSAKQVEELRLVRNLQRLGQRPKKIFSLSEIERYELLERLLTDELPQSPQLEKLLRELAPAEIEREMRSQLRRLGLDNFVHQIIEPLLLHLDHGWSDGSLSIAREHLVSDCLTDLLQEQLKIPPGDKSPKILFLTLSGERHKLGLLLAANLFRQQGLGTILLQEELPLSEVPQLASELRVAAVALSFSAHYSTRQAKQDLASLRRELPQEIKLIAGGQAVRRGIRIPNLIICGELQEIPELCRKHFSVK